MKKGKLILAAASAVLSVGGVLAFKMANKFTAHRVFVKTNVNLSPACHACIDLSPDGIVPVNTHCKTVAGGPNVLGTKTAGGHHYGFWTNSACTHEITKTTVTH